MTAVVIEPPAPLSLADRCDRCGAQAFVRASKNGLYLLFCGHHGHENLDALVMKDFVIHDFTTTINKKPSVSANA